MTMKKNVFFAGFLALTLAIAGCTSTNSEQPTPAPTTEPTAETSADSTEQATAAAEAQLTIEAIDQIRAEIEAMTVAPVEISTAGLREKTKQKWSKLHFYVENNVVRKVKTYPHASVSNRTEEFYATANGLVLVVIEDDGTGAKGKSKEAIDKMYYFDNGRLLAEIGNETEAEHTIKESDAEELLSEFNEYLQVYTSAQNK
jgi:hypothetical protein